MKKLQPRNQLMDLFFHVAAELGVKSDAELAEFARCSVQNVKNWRGGDTSEFKLGSFGEIKDEITRRVARLRKERLAVSRGWDRRQVPTAIEPASQPSALQRQFHEGISSLNLGYLGHRFLYFDPQGALAWETLIGSGYGQDEWVRGVETLFVRWTDAARAGEAGQHPLGAALAGRHLDVLSLGAGDGAKEARILDALARERERLRLRGATLALVDVSIPLLTRAAGLAHDALVANEAPESSFTARLVCADFEGGGLDFAGSLPASSEPDGRRLVLMLGNVFGNLENERTFAKRQLPRLVRPGDFLWIEASLRPADIQTDRVYQMYRDRDSTPSAAKSSRNNLLEGPYRRWEASMGRSRAEGRIELLVREDESCPIPGSVNLCHDLRVAGEQHVRTMLYTRRYAPREFKAWWAALGYVVEAEAVVEADDRSARMGHFLLRRKE